MAEHELLVVVTTPEGKVYNHRSYSVSADAVDGGITILPHHAPIMLPLKIGALRVKRFLRIHQLIILQSVVELWKCGIMS